MPGTRDIRKRIRSVTNTAKITNAMQLISASRLRRAQVKVINGKAYSAKMLKLLDNLSTQFDNTLDNEQLPPLLQKHTSDTVLLIILTPDRGLAGALIGNILKTVAKAIVEINKPVSVVTIGRKGERFILRTGKELIATFTATTAPTLTDVVPISRYIKNAYQSGKYGQVDLIYSQFISTTVQVPTRKTLLPVQTISSTDNSTKGMFQYVYEPTSIEVLSSLLPRYVETQVYQALLEAIASEHSARMIAMQNATDNANQLIQDLTLDLNKARQAYITSELLDIIGGVAALE